jgi:glycosyltransferase involved in cell wall biosynthesis/O-antigen/teichoic acid export membrane protein
MRVLLCHNYYLQPGGEDLVFADESALLKSRGHEVLHYTIHNEVIGKIGRLAAAGKTIWNQQIEQELFELIKDKQPDIVHCTNTFPLISPAIYYAARRAGTPVVQTLHNYRLMCPRGDFLRNGKVCESCMNKLIPWPSVLHGCYRGSRTGTAVVAGMIVAHRALKTWENGVDRYIAPSEFTRNKYIEGGLPAQSIVVKPNFVIQDSGIGKGGSGQIVFIGRLAKEKGVENLLTAWSQIDGAVQLKIVGDGPLNHLVQDAAARDDRIVWLGQRSFEEVLTVLGESDVLVSPSTCYETFGRTIIESFSKGTPVIASAHGAMSELIDDGRTGWVFDSDNPNDLASKITLALSDSKQLMAMRQAARKEFELKYTASANYEMLMNIYEDVINPTTDQPAAKKQQPGPSIKPFVKSGLRNGLALFDQALVSGTRFATTIIVGRVCGPNELGIYSLAFAFLILISCLQQALLGQPYTIYGNRLEGKRRAMLAGSVLVHYVVLSILAMVGLSLAAAVNWAGVGPPQLFSVLLILVAVNSLSLLWELGRWFAYAHFKLVKVVMMDFAVAVFQIGGILLLAWLGWLTIGTAYLMLGIASGLVGISWLILNRKDFIIRRKSIWKDWSRNWALGWWLAASQVTGVFHGHAMNWMLALMVGTYATGVFVAGESIVLLSNPIILGIGNLLSAETAQAYARGGKAQVKKVTIRAAAWMVGAMAPLYVVLVMASDALIWLFYGAEYEGTGRFIVVLAACTFAWAITAAVGKGLLAIERSDIVFRGTLAGLVVTLALGLPLVSSWEAIGAAWALLFGSFACAALQSIAFIWLVRKPRLRDTSLTQSNK